MAVAAIGSYSCIGGSRDIILQEIERACAGIYFPMRRIRRRIILPHWGHCVLRNWWNRGREEGSVSRYRLKEDWGRRWR